MIPWMQGKKSYLVAGAMAILALIFGLGLIDRETYEVLLGLLGAGGIGALRAGIKSDTQSP